MKRLILTVSLLLLFAPQAFAALKLNAHAPLFSLTDLKGNKFFLQDFVGASATKKTNGVIISFFASWCPPCRQELPIMNALVDEFRSKGIMIVLINVKEDLDTVKESLKELQVDQPLVLRDADGKMAKKYEIRFLPTTFFIGADGKLKDVIYGEIQGATQVQSGAEKLLMK